MGVSTNKKDIRKQLLTNIHEKKKRSKKKIILQQYLAFLDPTHVHRHASSAQVN